MALVLAPVMRWVLITIPSWTVGFLILAPFLFMLIVDMLTGHVDTKNTGVSVNAGPHDSKLANKMDPRVDSNLG